ncbi:MAG: nitrilase-related carbon-nitrogen hydrolase [Thermostichales cyanobacterium DRC_bins_46]
MNLQKSAILLAQNRQSRCWLWRLAAIAGTVTGCPGGWHHWLGGVVGCAPLLALGWDRPWPEQLRHALWVWIPVCGLVFVPDLGRVRVLTAADIVGGMVVAPLLPLLLVGMTMLCWQVAGRFPVGLRPWLVASLWTGVDGLAGSLWLPLPLHWGALIYDWPLGVQVADLGGIWLVTWLLLLLNGALSLVGRLDWRQWLGVLLPLTLALGYGQGRQQDIPRQMAASPSFRVAAPQIVAWFDDDGSWAYRQRQHEQIHRLSRVGIQRGADLLVWPEGALRSPILKTWLQTEVIDPLLLLLPPEGGLLTGASEPASPTTFINAALLFNAQGWLQDRSGKQWLFPYFESSRFIPDPGGYRPLAGGSRLGPLGVLICLESVLPAPSRALVQGGAESLVVISDDSWFGNSRWPLLHASLSVFRAVENRRSVVFVNNTGGNLIVDPSGTIQAQGSLFMPETIVGQVYRFRTGTLASRWGDWWVGVCWLVSAFALWRCRCQQL